MFVHDHLVSEDVRVFLAPASLLPGQNWSQEVLTALRDSSWVIFLASRAACSSPWVQQELGAALIAQKKLVPVVWDLPPAELPGWVRNFQALNLRGASIEQVKAQMKAIAERVKADKAQGLPVAGLLVAALFALGSK